jgi:molecular chaperone HscC
MIAGIDLGSTHSSIAFWDNNKPFWIPNAQGMVLRPSLISLDSSGKMIAGSLENGGQALSLAGVKRLLGKNKVFRLGKDVFRAEELIAFMIRSLISDGERYLKREIQHAVITVPAYFHDVQRKCILHAGELAGITVECLLNDPTAAALVFNSKNPLVSGKVLIFDLGGGTFDVSVAQLSIDCVAVCSSSGDSCLGGDDFVDVLESHILEKVSEQCSIDCGLLPFAVKKQWRGLVQKMVHELTLNNEAFFFAAHGGKEIKIPITSSQFEEITRPLMDRIHAALIRVVEDAGLAFQDIERVVLIGGAARMPLIAETISRMFGKQPEFLLSSSGVASLGAAISTSVQKKLPEGNHFVISDVCPYFLGIRVAEKRGGNKLGFIPVLARNTVVPRSRTDRFFTCSDYQTTFHIEICQGESYHYDSQVLVGDVLVLVPPRPAGQECVEVRCSYDRNGLLEVEVLVLSTGKYKKFISHHQLHYLS